VTALATWAALAVALVLAAVTAGPAPPAPGETSVGILTGTAAETTTVSVLVFFLLLLGFVLGRLLLGR